MGKTVLISGCTNGGIGFCLADEFNRKGYNVFASARKLESMSNLPESITRVVVRLLLTCADRYVAPNRHSACHGCAA